jgi:hypothetical protein
MMASGACVSTPGFFEKISLYVFTTKNKLVRQQACQQILLPLIKNQNQSVKCGR